MDRTQMFNFHDDFSRFVLSFRIYIGQLTSYHFGNDIVSSHFGCRPGSYICTVSHDRDIICDSFDLIHLMRNVDHGNTFVSQIIHDSEKSFYFVI